MVQNIGLGSDSLGHMGCQLVGCIEDYLQWPYFSPTYQDRESSSKVPSGLMFRGTELVLE